MGAVKAARAWNEARFCAILDLMAERNKCLQAIILSLKEAGDKAQQVKVLCPTRGVFSATLWGGGKSRLKQLVQPFYSGDLYIYEKTSGQPSSSPTIKDFDAKVFRPSLRENLDKTLVCWAACELVAATECAGEAERAYKLLLAFLDGIEATASQGARSSLLRFLRRYSSLLGLARSAASCTICGTPLSDVAFVWQQEEGFLCPSCAATKGSELHMLSTEALSYLRAVDEAAPAVSRKTPLSPQARGELEDVLFDQAARAAGRPLKALDAVRGVH